MGNKTNGACIVITEAIKCMSFLQRFEDKYTKTDKCWLWESSIDSHGYGQIRFRQKNLLAHRVNYAIHNGDIPSGLCVLHRCDVRNCVNPNHLFLGTNADNVADKMAKGRLRMPDTRGENNGFAKLSESDVLVIRASQCKQSDIAAEFKISQSTVSEIKRRVKWGHVPERATR